MKKLFLVTICTVFFATSICFGYQLTFEPYISVGGEYTDNFFLNDANKEDEFITTITPAFTAQVLGKKAGADLSFSPSYAMYNTNDERNTWRHRANFFGYVDIAKRTRLEVRDYFFLTEDPQPESESDTAVIRTEDPDRLIDYTERRTRFEYYTNTAAIKLTHQFGESDSFFLDYNYYFIDNDDPTIEDSKRYNPSLGLTYWFLPQWGFQFNGNYVKGEFEESGDKDGYYGDVRLIKQFTRNFEGFLRYSHTLVNYERVTEDDRTYNPSIGLNYNIDKDISLILDVGWFYNDFKLRDDNYGPTADLRLIKTFKRGSLNLGAFGGYDYVYFGAENLGFSIYSEADVSATYQFTRHVSGNIFGAYRYDQYKDVIPERDDKNARAGLGLLVQPLRWMSFGLQYTFRSLDSNQDSRDYDENRFYINVKFFPSQPYRTTQ